MQLKRAIRIIKLAIFSSIVTAGIILLISWLSINDLPQKKTAGILRILSMNVTSGNVLDKKLQDGIISSDPDVIVIIEWSGNNIDLGAFKQNGYTVLIDLPRKVVHGICVLSKTNGSASIIEAPVKTPCTLPLGLIRFNYGQRHISLFAVHAPPPVPQCEGTNNDYITAMSKWVEDGRIKAAMDIAEKDDLVIFAGDFNCFSFGRGITDLKNKKLKDTFGDFSLLRQTWKPFAGGPYLAGIDYILVPDDFEVSEHFRFNIPGSDHLGIIADVKMERK